jgi:hypothetical protein
MKRGVLLTLIVSAAVIMSATIATPQQSQVIHFQGMLTGPDDGPLRTDIYDVNFSIWDQESGGAEPEWSEIQVVEVTDGLFDVFLGNQIPLSADVFTHAEGESDLRYLEIQVLGDDPMTPRIQIAKTPNSFVSSRVLGDVVTGPGSFRMVHPPEGPGIEMIADEMTNSINFRLVHPPELPALDILSDGGNNITSFKLAHPPESPGVEIISDAIANSVDFRLVHPPESPAIEMTAGDTEEGGRASIKMFNPQPEPPAEPLLEMNTTQYGANLAMAAPGAGGLRNEITDPMFKVYVDTSGSSVQLMDPADPEIVGLEMVVDSSGPKFRARFPQIPGQNIGLEIMTSSVGPAGNQASLRMFNPQPEPPAVVTSMVSSEEGASFTMYAPLFDQQGDVMFDVFIDAQGANLSLYDEIGKYMGFEPSPFYDGGYLKMFDPVTDNTMVSLGSDGSIQAKKATFGNSSNDGDYNLVVGMGNQASGDYNFVGGYQAQSDYNNCFLWADYSTYQPLASSAANQFLVRSSGGIAFYSSGNMMSGVALGPGEYSWSSIVPPGPELNTRPVDGEEILTKVEQLPLLYYSHKDQENGVEHIGPMAQDFYALFGLGEDERHISTLDPSGVALAGVKELLNRIEELEYRIAELEAEKQ